MKKNLIAIFIAAAALPVAAQSTPPVDARQANQVQAMESKAGADGKLTPRERARLAKEQNRQSKKIAKQRHDKQRKAPAS